MNDMRYSSISDNDFIRGDVPMTKEEVRTLSISKLRLNDNSRMIDIGAGTGSVSIEAAIKASNGFVYSVEKNSEALDLIGKNKDKFGIQNIKIINGMAPGILEGIDDFDRVFIGGSGGNLEDILNYVTEKLPASGIIVINSITLETLSKSREFFKNNNYKFETIQVSISRIEEGKKFAMLKANNPVFIISGEKI